MSNWFSHTTGINPVPKNTLLDIKLSDRDEHFKIYSQHVSWHISEDLPNVVMWRYHQEPFQGLETAYDIPVPPLVGGFKYPTTDFKPTEIDNKRPINSRVAEAYNAMCGGNLDSNDIEVILTIVKLMDNFK